MNNFLATFLIAVLSSFSCNHDRTSQELNNFSEMAAMLNQTIPDFREIYDSKGFYIDNEGHPKNFFVYDLVDTSYNSYPMNIKFKLKKEGVYHFSSIRYELSFSHIAVIKDYKMKIFTNINCKENGDRIEDVINYVKSNFNYNEKIIDRILRYRSFGIYFQTDPQATIHCK